MNKKERNIGFICTSFDNVAGGLERQIIRTSKSLSLKGFNIYIFSFDNYSAKSFYKIPNFIRWIKCGNGLEPHKYASRVDRFKQLFFLRKEIKNNKITDLITFHHGIFPRIYLATLFMGINNIISERNSLSNYNHIKLNKINLGYLSLFLANKITVQLKSYKNDYPIALRKRIYVINNILKKPLNEYKKPNLSSNNVAMLGRLCTQKNFTPLLDQIQNSNIKTLKNLKINIAGEGFMRTQIEREYRDLISDSILELKGNLKNIDEFLSNSSIFCFPSLWEGYPNSLAEALRMGLPVITSNRMKYLTEFVEHGVNGLIVEDHELLSAVKYLFKDRERLLSMSKESYKKYSNLCKSNPTNDWIKLLR